MPRNGITIARVYSLGEGLLRKGAAGKGEKMNASVTTVDRFEARTTDALAGVTRLGLSLKMARYKGELLAFEMLSTWLVRRVVATFHDRWLSNLTAEQARTVTPRLAELYQTLDKSLQLADLHGFIPKRIHRHFLESLAQARDRIGDVVESLYLGGNEDFNELLRECVDEIKKHRGGPRRDWRSALAAMRD